MSNKPKFIGLNTVYPTASGENRQRVHLDGAASPLACETGVSAAQALLPHYSNSHSYVHSSAKISTQALNWARQQILTSLGADPLDYAVIFIGSGCTAAINRIARGLAASRSDKKTVLVSAMEHHANDLPHRQHDNTVIHIPLTGEYESMGTVNLEEFEKLCAEHAQTLNYIAVSSVSNVTGIRNPIKQITEIAHKYGALVLLDAAQSVAHISTKLSAAPAEQQADFVVFSGHKIYTPTAPGVLVAKKQALKNLLGQDLGGGSVDTVSYENFDLSSELPTKDESGTANIVGAYALASVMQTLSNYGYAKIEQHGQQMIKLLHEGLSSIDGLTVYGDPKSARVAALAFNHAEIDHGLLAAILNDYYAIAVRNECFCAHPYVSSLLKRQLWDLSLEGIEEGQQEAYINRKRGMVRASISLYNTESDIELLINSVRDIAANKQDYEALYRPIEDGSYEHMEYKLDWTAVL